MTRDRSGRSHLFAIVNVQSRTAKINRAANLKFNRGRQAARESLNTGSCQSHIIINNPQYYAPWRKRRRRKKYQQIATPALGSHRQPAHHPCPTAPHAGSAVPPRTLRWLRQHIGPGNGFWCGFLGCSPSHPGSNGRQRPLPACRAAAAPADQRTT